MMVTLVSLIGFYAAPAVLSGDTIDGVPFSDTWETLLAEARVQERQCGDDTYAAGPPLTWNDHLGAAA
ncbi:hypothetical protein QWY84_19195 [Aquisalimonas lutea]|uniref:hypothetical protein n=1 Tax=Aquisalimonas lutea TaxID=1327750 RepID=UPI0025B5187D|nr:hypothetical protein [Aquisalimonas lutea]MDN3519738.1 hypothetical protein [Aquisalimonas lutea]